uniref:Ycf34 n=1 Tax=Spermothamnion repens TaxID=31383 RepID=A0A4D6WXV6_9FLOR|nr:hypothetical protein [Spermothamnion repens]
MCICINCRHIAYCSTYIFIKQQHNKKVEKKIPIFNEQSNKFIPSEHIINVSIKVYSQEHPVILDWDLKECLSFIEKPGSWLNTIF